MQYRRGTFTVTLTVKTATGSAQSSATVTCTGKNDTAKNVTCVPD